jgi:hypothetical protein
MTDKVQVKKRRRRVGCLPVVLILIVAPIIAWKVLEHRFRLWLIPEDLGVWWISYAEQESWGFGPGGNETSVIIYALPEEAARATSASGAAYLNQLDSAARPPRDRHNMFGEWKPTPVLEGELGKRANLAGYLNRYGFGIRINRGIETYINSVISSPGSFYAYGRIGVAIVDPSERKVVFLHSG